MNATRTRMPAWTVIPFLALVMTASLSGCAGLRYLTDWIPFFNFESQLAPKEQPSTSAVVSRKMSRPELDGRYMQALHLQARNKHRIAVQVLREILIVDPVYEKAYTALGVSYDSLGDFERAEEAYRMALQLNPDLDYVHNNLGYSYLLQGKHDQAIDALYRAISLNRDKSQYRNNLALAYVKKRLFRSAFEELKLAGEEAYAHKKLADLLYAEGFYGKAAEHYAEANRFAPDEPDLKHGLAAARTLTAISKAAPSPPEPGSPGMDGEAFPAIVDLQPAPAAPSGFAIAADYQPRPPKARPKVAGMAAASGQATAVIDIPAPRERAASELAESVKTSDPETLPERAAQPAGVDMAVNLQPLAASVGVERLGTPPVSAQIEVTNGKAESQAAALMCDHLRKKNYRVIQVKPTQPAHFSETLVLYLDGYLHDAYRVAQEIPGYQNMKQVDRLRKLQSKIAIEIGKDLIPITASLQGR